MPTMESASSAVELLDIRKQFGSVQALDRVSMTLRPGRVHGLLGENGAGKSTLMNILYGLLRPDSGRVLLSGKPTTIRSPHAALGAGIGMVHQHFMLAGAMTVLDNVLLGDRRAPQWLDRSAAAARLRQLSQRLGLTVDPFARISELSVGQQQRVEILKALFRDVKVLILDEPTAVLTPSETQQLFAAVDRLRGEGRSIVFISHKLAEVLQICDDLTILRRGRVVFDGPAAGVSAEELSRHMVGRDIEPIRRAAPVPEARGGGPACLSVHSLTAPPLHDASFDLHPGEILGVAGVDGNGQQELAESIAGLRPIRSGRILLSGADITRASSADRFRLGLAHIPNDRKREGLVGSMSIAENIALKRHANRPFAHPLGILSWRSIRRTARDLVARYDVRTPSIHAPAATLSGGNQQKLILARELALSEPRLILAMNPVRGLDIAATHFVYEQLLAVRARGGAVLLISSELDELLALCDRIGVLYNGRFSMSDFPRDGAAERIGHMMTGAVAA
jgi:simple sugar transport system ATP-binding protein